MPKATKLVSSLLVAISMPVIAFAAVAMDGTNANASYIYSESTYSGEVEFVNYSNSDEVEFFKGDEDSTQYLYIGMEVPFDKVKIDLSESVKFADDPKLEFDYYDGSVWESLDVDTSYFDDFLYVDKESFSFKAPNNWSQGSFEAGNGSLSPNAYWIRISADEVSEGGAAVQISVVAYFTKITVEDNDGNGVNNLSEENFMLSEGSDNEIYGVLSQGDGQYLLAVNISEDITSYRLVVSVPGYEQKATDLIMDGDNKVSIDMQISGGNESCTPNYLDTDYHWAQSAIRELYCRQILQIDSVNFRPNTRVSKAEFLKMALLNAGVDTEFYTYKVNPFDDVDREEDWYAQYAIAAYNLDVIDGDTDFRADYSLNRVDAVVILMRLAGIEGDSYSTPFYDIAESDWFAKYIRAAADLEVVEGYEDGSFQPNRYLSRAEAAVMVNNMYYAKYKD